MVEPTYKVSGEINEINVNFSAVVSIPLQINLKKHAYNDHRNRNFSVLIGCSFNWHKYQSKGQLLDHLYWNNYS